jgi:hypothetical protein
MRDGSPSILRTSCPQLQAALRVIIDRSIGCGDSWSVGGFGKDTHWQWKACLIVQDHTGGRSHMFIARNRGAANNLLTARLICSTRDERCHEPDNGSKKFMLQQNVAVMGSLTRVRSVADPDLRLCHVLAIDVD